MEVNLSYSYMLVPEGIKMTDAEIISAIYFQEQWFDTVIVR